MSWTAPMTAIAGSVFTAAQFNTFVRDNLNECPAAKASTPGSMFVTSATNQVAERTPVTAAVAAQESTTSLSFVNLTTPGPAVTLVTGSTALIIITSQVNDQSASFGASVGVDISGATSESADISECLRHETNGTTEFNRSSAVRLHTSLTPGTNTFKLMYLVDGGTGQFRYRTITVVPF